MRSPSGRPARSTVAAVRGLAAGSTRLRNWVLIELDRYVLAGSIAAVTFVLFLWLEVSGTIDVARSTAPLLYLFSALAGGNVTLITIVVSINQLILSRELRSPRELQTEIGAAEQFRDEVEAESDRVVVPEQPSEFLLVLVRDVRNQVAKIDDAGRDLPESGVGTDLSILASTLEAELEETAERLEESGEGVFPALATILEADFATHINRTRWIERAHADELVDPLPEHLEGLERRLEQLDIARQYFKTIYIKQELADVSTLVMSTGVVAVVVAIVFIVFTGYLVRPLPPLEHRLFVPLAVSINLVPLALLISHVLRIATVARRTAAITPFLAPTE